MTGLVAQTSCRQEVEELELLSRRQDVRRSRDVFEAEVTDRVLNVGDRSCDIWCAVRHQVVVTDS